MIISSATDFRRAAQRRLPRFLFDYIEGAANTEVTSRRNIEDLAGIALRQRVLTDVSRISLSANFFGRAYSLPVGLSPVGLSGMYARRGEVQAKQAAAKKGVPMCLSTLSVCSLEEVAAASPDPPWFQLYVIRDRPFMLELIARAKAAGCGALVFTVDMPVAGARYRDPHSGMSGPYAPVRRVLQSMTHPRWAWDVGLLGRPHALGNLSSVLGRNSGLKDYMGWIGQNFDPSVCWRDLEFVRANWDGPLVIKGILDPEDAREAAKLGANGIIVSNHGGRQLDGVFSTVRALPGIAAAVRDDLTVFVDGGVYSGLDVLRMLALGAHGVFLGRAWAYALAAQGGDGVTRLLEIVESEMRVAMALTGSVDVSKLDRSVLAA
jgi:L-lactate dehydrogenase (cytochrome)